MGLFKVDRDLEVNVVKVQGIWDDEDEILKNVMAVWGILPKGITKLKKRVVEDNVTNITSRDIGEGSKPTEPKEKEENEEEDRVLTQLKKT